LPSACRFILRFAGILLCGNIGIVYNYESSPQKIHDCELHQECNISTCHYYHDPLHYPGSMDIRNFVAASWIYAPGAAPSARLPDAPSTDDDPRFIATISKDYSIRQRGTRTRTFTSRGAKKVRKFSSRDHLDSDILTVSSSDLAFYNEQLMHDILCGILMNYYVKRDS
jgi:hypothetical protein